MLTRPHRLDGIVVHGEKRGREIGYPTANLGNIDGQTIPADGVYAGWLTVGIDRWPAAIQLALIQLLKVFEDDKLKLMHWIKWI
jgi:riboflavin kinase/FMN adenylyltransferase